MLPAHHFGGLDIHHPLLTALLPSDDQEPARRLTTTDAHQIYRLAATAFRVDLTLHAGTCLTSTELEHAERCGLLIRTTDARRPGHQLSA